MADSARSFRLWALPFLLALSAAACVQPAESAGPSSAAAADDAKAKLLSWLCPWRDPFVAEHEGTYNYGLQVVPGSKATVQCSEWGLYLGAEIETPEGVAILPWDKDVRRTYDFEPGRRSHFDLRSIYFDLKEFARFETRDALALDLLADRRVTDSDAQGALYRAGGEYRVQYVPSQRTVGILKWRPKTTDHPELVQALTLHLTPDLADVASLEIEAYYRSGAGAEWQPHYRMAGPTVTTVSKDIEDLTSLVSNRRAAPVTTPVELVYGDKTVAASASLSLEGPLEPAGYIRATILVTPPPDLAREPWDHRQFERTVIEFPPRVHHRKTFRRDPDPGMRLFQYLPATSTVLLLQQSIGRDKEVRLVLNEDHTAVRAFRLTLRRLANEVLVRVTRKAPP
jgi:hypothetical protein